MIQKILRILSFTSADQDGLHDIVRRVDWQYQVIDGPYVASIYGDTILPDPDSDNYVSYMNLTREQAEQWVISNNDMAEIEAQALAKLDQARDPSTLKSKPLPWSMNEYTGHEHYVLVQGNTAKTPPMLWNSGEFNVVLESLGLPADLPANHDVMIQRLAPQTEPMILDAGSNTAIWLVQMPLDRPHKDRFQENHDIEIDFDQWPAQARFVLRDIALTAAKDISRHMIRARVFDLASTEVSQDINGSVRMISAHPGTVYELELALSVPWSQDSMTWLFSDGSTGLITKTDIQTLLNRASECLMSAKTWGVQSLALVDSAGSVQELRQIMAGLGLWE